MKKKKILIIGYGGTIMMIVDERRKAVMPAENMDQILALLPRLQEVADIDLEVLTNKDSTNVTPGDWILLAEYIYDRHDKYDGFLITHGTNTMSYTASALALALGPGLKKPIILTGSQLPLTVYGNDARFNFENSLKTAVIAAEEKIAEVMIVFSDVILRAARAVKVSESAFRAFESPAFPALGMITSTGIHFGPLTRRGSPKTPLKLEATFNTDIVSIDLTPGQLPTMIWTMILNGKCNGIIFKSHGAGSVPTEGQYSFIPLIKRTVQDYKIPVIISTKFLGGSAYKEVNDECALLAIEAGAIPGGDLTDVMTEVKLMWTLGQKKFSIADVRKTMLKDYVGEISEIKLENTSKS